MDDGTADVAAVKLAIRQFRYNNREMLDLDAFSVPTTYRGIRMRSQLEARQAARMDLYGWHWEYEPERFYSQDDTYLPDFWVDMGKSVDCYLEIKGAYPDDMRAVQKRMEIVWRTKPEAFLCILVDETEGLYGAHGDRDRVWRHG